jgi:hypothetical protein
MSPSFDDSVPWMSSSRETWLADVSNWTRAELNRRGYIPAPDTEILHDRPRAIVLRFETTAGWFYFKASASAGAHEAVLSQRLSSRWPKLVPAPLAINQERGWIVMPHAGLTMRDYFRGSDPLPTWKVLLPAYAAIQSESAIDRDALLALGLPDCGMVQLPTLLRELLSRDASISRGRADGISEVERQDMFRILSSFEEQCARLRALGIPDGIEHGDLHEGNVLVEDSALRLIDWADSCLSHPFCSMLVILSTIQRGRLDLSARAAIDLRNVYLGQWEGYAQLPMLQDLFPVSLWIAHVIRALCWDRMLADAPEGLGGRYQTNVAHWLRLWYDRREAMLAPPTS